MGWAPPAGAQLTESQRADLEIWKSVLSTSPADLNVQRTAARRLLESGWDESMQVISERLGDFDRPELVTLICTSIRDMDVPPEQLFDPLLNDLIAAPPELLADLADAIGSYSTAVLPRLIDRLRRPEAPASEKISLIAALSRFTEVEVVDELINCLDAGADAQVRAAALQALVSVTGADHGDSMTRWQSWWRNNRIQGREGLIRRKLRRLERERSDALVRIQVLQRDVASLTSDLLTALNRNYTLTDAAQRNALLLSLLQDPRVPVRRLGLDLVEQRVLNAENLTPEVIAALEKIIADPVPALRPPAIRRLALVDATRAASLVGPALAQTQDPEMEAAILAVLAQTASAEAVPALVERFLMTARPKGSASAVLTATVAGLIAPDSLDQIAARLAETDAANLSAAESELLAWCGNEAAQAMLTQLFESPQTPADRKAAAARGLVASGRHPQILVANAGDPIVYPFALRAAGKRGGLEGLRLILGWNVLDPAKFSEEVTQALSALAPADWLEADNLLATHESVSLLQRINSLTRVLTLPQQPNSTGAGEATLAPALRRQVCLRLAELQWNRADAEAMLTAVQAAPPGDNEADRQARWRNIALVALDRFDAADATRGSDWVDALDLVLRQKTADVERANRIAEAIRNGRATGLTEGDRNRFDALLSKIALLTPVPETDGG